MLIDWDVESPIDVPISAIEHFSYCPRQCALIHVEQTYDENLYTIRGRLTHERIVSGVESTEHGVRVLRDVPLWSERLGLHGRADVIEFHGDRPYPVEYKSGRQHGVHPDLQLCAQAMCLEEMLECTVPAGAVYHHATRRRREVRFNEQLRDRVVQAVDAIRQMLREQTVPEAPNDARCSHCSLRSACMPNVVGEPDRLRGLQGSLFRPLEIGSDP